MNQYATSDDGFVEFGGGVSVFLKPKYLREGDVIQGIFERREPVFGKFGHPVIFLKLTRPLTYGDNLNAEKTYEAGESVGVGVPNQLNGMLSRAALSIGQEIRITYLGKEPAKAGEHKGADTHTFKLGVKPRPQSSANPTAIPE